MIRPTKYMKLSQCTLSVAAQILADLQPLVSLRPFELEERVMEKLGDVAVVNLQSALNLLYLVGLIEYDAPSDSIVHIARPSGDDL